jgi:hypothetical protein
LHYGKDYESQSIRSALVKPLLASSLLRTLQTGNRYDYHIPHQEENKDTEFEDDDYEEHKDNLTDTFKLRGWIKNIRHQKEGVDESDGTIETLDKGRQILGDTFSKWSGLTFSHDFRFSFTDPEFKNPLSILDNWSNSTRKESYGSFTSEGQRLFMRIDKLLEFLKANNVL